MTEGEYRTHFDFLCEKRLHHTNNYLHHCFFSSVFAMERLLRNYINIFPFFTDHTFAHSEQVINYCNIIAGADIIEQLNPDELYILLMGAALHDVGMGISENDFADMRGKIPGLSLYMKAHPNECMAEYVRAFHQEFSAQFIKKYSALFEIPSQEYIDCIAQTARGHRKVNLLDLNEYPTAYPLPNGSKVNLAYIGALVKLADELDILADRNLLFDYTRVNALWPEKQIMCYKCHGALKKLRVDREALVLCYATQEAAVEQELLRLFGKVVQTFGEYTEVVETRSHFTNRIKRIELKKIRQ